MRFNAGCFTVLFALVHCLVVNANTHEFDFHVSNLEVNGVRKTVINGQYPGPLVRVPYGSRVEVNLFNDLDINHTTIHWHGLHQRGTPYSDGFPTQNQCAIPAGKKMKYDFTADPAGTTFWHAHFHSMALDGLHGPFIVEDKPGSYPFHYDEERVILLTDEYGSTSWELEDYLASPDPNGNPHPDPAPTAGLLCLYDEKNGGSVTSCSRDSTGQGFNLDFEPGKVYRLRIICGSIIAPFIFSIDQHELQLVSSDYSILDGNTWVKGVPIATGQRYDVLVRTNDTFNSDETFWVRATMQSQCWPPNNATYDPDVRGVLTYNRKPNATIATPQSTTWNVTNPTCEDIDYSLLKPYPSSLDESSSLSLEQPSMSLFLNVTFPVVEGPDLFTLVNSQIYHVNDTAYPTLYAVQKNASWTPPASEQRNLMIIPDEYRGKSVRIVLQTNGSEGTHPFHMHGHGFQVVGSGVGFFDDAGLAQVNSVDLRDVVVRDTVIVPGDGWRVIQVTANNPGVWALHCHVGWHLQNGMLGQIVELPKAISTEIHIPQAHKNLCESKPPP